MSSPPRTRAKPGGAALYNLAMAAAVLSSTAATVLPPPEKVPPAPPPPSIFLTPEERSGSENLKRGLELIGSKYKSKGKKEWKIYNVRTAAKEAGVNYVTLWRHHTNKTQSCRLGAPRKTTEEHYRYAAHTIRSNQLHTSSKKQDSLYTDLASLAEQDGRPYKGNRVPATTVRRIKANLEKMTARDKRLPGADPSLGTIGCGSAISTSTSRQKASKPGTTILFFKSIEAAIESHPQLKHNPEAWINIDESQVLTRGEEFIGYQKVFYDRTIKEARGAARANVVKDGTNRISLIQCVAGDGFVCRPAFFSSGTYVQGNWFRGDAPPGVDKDWIKSLWIHPTKSGVATAKASLLAFENCISQVRERLDTRGYDGAILCTTDAPDVHGIKWNKDGTVEVSNEMRTLCSKYNVILCPLPHNT